MTQKFWSRVARAGDNECWEWRGSRTRKGYGNIAIPGLSRSAHRAAWQLQHGDIPAGMNVCHRCDNPGCVNPAHLFLGTQLDNIADMVAKGRQRGDYRPGSKCPTAKLFEAQVLDIKRRVAGGETQRAVARAYGVSFYAISDIVRGKTWVHVKAGTTDCSETPGGPQDSASSVPGEGR